MQWVVFQKNKHPSEKPVEFKTMSDTRWAGQVRKVSAISSRFDCFIEFLRHVDRADANRDRALVARNICVLHASYVQCVVRNEGVI